MVDWGHGDMTNCKEAQGNLPGWRNVLIGGHMECVFVKTHETLHVKQVHFIVHKIISV